MQTRRLGNIEVSAIGYGAMGLSHGYGAIPERAEAIRLIQYAYDLGCTFIDTAEGYAKGDNEELVGDAIKGFRNNIVLATKFTIERSNNNDTVAHTRQHIREHLENSLKRLKTDRVDLYYLHRISKTIPLEEIADAMGDFIKEGKVLGWGLSQVSETEVRRSHAITPLTAIQSEYSIMERMYENDVIPTCAELGIGFVPFSPLASGFLSGKISPDTNYSGDDVRRVITRFDKNNIEANKPLLDLLIQFAQEKNATPAQISLAWMLHKKDFIVPIPGSKKAERIQENIGAANLTLTDNEFERIEKELAKIKIYGNRTDEDIAKLYTQK